MTNLERFSSACACYTELHHGQITPLPKSIRTASKHNMMKLHQCHHTDKCALCIPPPSNVTHLWSDASLQRREKYDMSHTQWLSHQVAIEQLSMLMSLGTTLGKIHTPCVSAFLPNVILGCVAENVGSKLRFFWCPCDIDMPLTFSWPSC